MKLLKKLWEKCGEKAFTEKVMVVVCTLLTIYNIIFTTNIPELNGLLVFLNGALIFALVMEEDD